MCVTACPYTPSSIIWNFEKGVAQKCDLCIDTPYWNEKGGADGMQACVENCPMEAIRFTGEIPTQIGDMGYKVNLRGEGWPMDRC
jgi:Fe-S-cluster-containing dehydrogenase component